MNRILGTIFHDALTDQGGPETPQGQVDGQPQDQLTTDPEQDNPVLDAGGKDVRARAAYLQSVVDKYNQAFNQHPDIKAQLFGGGQPQANKLQQRQQQSQQQQEVPEDDEYITDMKRADIIALQKEATREALREEREKAERTAQLQGTIHGSVAQVAQELGYTSETVAPVLREVQQYKFDMDTEAGLRAYGYTVSLALAVHADADAMMLKAQEAAAKAADAARHASLAQPPGPGRTGPQVQKSREQQHLTKLEQAAPPNILGQLDSVRK